MTAEMPVKAVLGAVRFSSNGRYAWLGERIQAVPKRIVQSWTEHGRRDYTLQHLKARIYNDFYCAGRPRPASLALAPYQGRAMTPFMKQLSAANHGRGHESLNWRAEAQENDALVTSKDGLRLRVRVERDVREQGADGRITLRFPKEYLNHSPGFYVAVGDRYVDAAREDVLLRFYFNLTPDGAIRFLEEITPRLNRFALAFRIKSINDPARFDRCDAVVLYVARSDFQSVSTIVAETYPVIADALKGPAPPFTKTLAPGLGLAEDPGGGESFGTHRCGVLAEGLVEAHARGLTSLTARFDVVRAQFKTRSIRFDRPYLTASSSDDYHLTLPPVARRNPRARNLATPLTAAAEIGARLARQALWHGGACTWVGEDPESVASSRGWGAKTTYSALGPDLYAGSSGVALFLAELSLASGDAVSRRCAVGALRHALDRSIDETDFGLYTGLLGVAWTAVHIGRLLGEAEFIERGGALAAKAETAPNRPDDGEADLFSGKAGAIVALLLLAEDLGNAALNVRAVSLGDMLLRMADVDATGMSWRSPAQRRGRNLTGFAHGAAGVGFALARLFARTRVAAYGEAARRAFAYERRWFDASLGNWRDFRRFDAREGGARDHKSAFAMAWCHGAPGVALSRLEGLAAVGDHLCKDEALTALRTTVEHTKTSLASGGNRGCLCHGLAGNADILLSGARSLQCDFGVGDALAEIAAETVQTASSDENEPPGLMLGMAGQGYALLRRHNPAIPSVLALGAR